MATITVELDDAIYQTALKILALEGMSMDGFIKAMLETVVIGTATGIHAPELTTEMQVAVKKALDRARRLSSPKYNAEDF